MAYSFLNRIKYVIDTFRFVWSIYHNHRLFVFVKEIGDTMIKNLSSYGFRTRLNAALILEFTILKAYLSANWQVGDFWFVSPVYTFRLHIK